MIIDRFGSTYASAYQLPTLKGEDDWTSSRPPASAKVGGMNGAFDFYGSSNYPIEALTVKKSFTMVGTGYVTNGTGTITMDAGDPTISGSGTLFLSELAIGDVITAGSDAHTVISITDNDTLTASNPADHIGGVSYTITHNTIKAGIPSYSYIDTKIDALKLATINAGESKLWGLLRGGSQRWAYAKCVVVDVPENYQNKMAVPVSLEFYCREGVWYSADPTTSTITQATSQPVSVPTVGTLSSNVVFTITSSSGTMTGFTLTNTTNSDAVTWAGSAGVGVAVVIDSAAYTVTKGGVGNYAGLTYGANQINWFRLAAGANSITLSVTGSTAWSASLVRYDTYL